MMLRLAAGGLAGLLLLAACAPSPGSPAPTGAPAATESVASASPSEPQEEGTQAAPTAAETPSSSPAASRTAEPSEAPTPSTSPAETVISPTAEPTGKASASGWVVVDRKVSTEAEADAAGLPSAVTQYVKSRLAEPCNVQFTLFTVHPDGYLVADESGICAGAALFVYGPDDSGRVSELVEFTSVQPCSSFRNVEVPTGVPKTKLLPDGLVCNDGGAKSY